MKKTKNLSEWAKAEEKRILMAHLKGSEFIHDLLDAVAMEFTKECIRRGWAHQVEDFPNGGARFEATAEGETAADIQVFFQLLGDNSWRKNVVDAAYEKNLDELPQTLIN